MAERTRSKAARMSEAKDVYPVKEVSLAAGLQPLSAEGADLDGWMDGWVDGWMIARDSTGRCVRECVDEEGGQRVSSAGDGKRSERNQWMNLQPQREKTTGL